MGAPGSERARGPRGRVRRGAQHGAIDCISRSPRRPAPFLLQDADAPALHWQLLLQAPSVALGPAQPRPRALKPCCSLLVNTRGRGGRERDTSHSDRTDVNTASRPPALLPRASALPAPSWEPETRTQSAFPIVNTTLPHGSTPGIGSHGLNGPKGVKKGRGASPPCTASEP